MSAHSALHLTALIGYLETESWREAEAAFLALAAESATPSEAWRAAARAVVKTAGDPALTARLRRAIEAQPASAFFRYLLGHALARASELAEARREFQAAARLEPKAAAAHAGLAVVLAAERRFRPAIAAQSIAIGIEPTSLRLRQKLAHLLSDADDLDAALASARDTAARFPQSGATRAALGFLLAKSGRIEAALEEYRAAVALEPDSAEIHSALLFTQLLDPRFSAPELCAEARQWANTHVAHLAAPPAPHAHIPDPDRPLRIGYVSPDLRAHAASYFIRTLWPHHDRARYHLTAYANVAAPDATTRRLRQHVDRWHDITSLADADVAALVRADRIDVLVDLAQHVAGHRLRVFARKPAPVQVAWLGLLGTTGLDAIDYLLVDPQLVPPASDWCTEKPWVLPETWCCYDPGEIDLPVGPLPALANGHVTFGSLHRFNKISAAVLRLWSRVLRAVPDARLLMQCPAGETRERARAAFAAQGVDPARVDFVSALPRGEYFALHHRIDIALDPFPHPGHTTTCDALWMGVPVLTLAGRTLAGRAGCSLLTNAGLAAWIAPDEDDYVARAAQHANARDALAALRGRLRAQFRRSPVMDGTRFARHIEDAYRAMWRRWCAGARGAGLPEFR